MKLSFKVYSQSGAIFAADSVMEKSCGLVLVGEVQNSSLLEGDTIGIQTGDKMPIYDTVKRIELDHEKIVEATEGMVVGVCLDATTKEGLLQYLGK